MHVLFNFFSNRYTFVAAAKKKGADLYTPLEMSDDIPTARWLNFIRHHDELNLKMLPERDRELVWSEFAPEENMRIYGHGIRRRLAPMLGNNQARMRMFYTLVFGLPGITLVNNGEEIGMGDELSLKERESVRTPIHWSSGKNGGFSGAAAEKLYRPVIEEGTFSYQNVNVMDQLRDPGSFINFMSRLIRAKRQLPLISEGKMHMLKSDDERTAGWYFEQECRLLIVTYNLSDEEICTGFHHDNLNPDFLMPVFEDSRYDDDINISELRLNSYGFRWLEGYQKNSD
jgi:maltose alpha-D-glucosyltransferase/alpha-amylase